MKRPCSISRQDEEHRRPRYRDKVQREQDNKLDNLSQGKWRIHCADNRLAESFDRVIPFQVQNPRPSDELFMALVYHNGIEDINQRLIDEESFE